MGVISYRIVAVVAATGLLAFMSREAAAQTPNCDPSFNDLVAVHSSLVNHPVTAGSLRTSDQSVLVTVARPKSGRAISWSLEGGTLPGEHAFVTEAGDPDEDRVDVSKLYQTLKVSFVNGAPPSASCTITKELISIPAIASQDHLVFLLQPGLALKPKLLSDMQFGGGLTLANSFVSFDGATFHANGTLVLAGKLRSTSIIDLQLAPPANGAQAQLQVAAKDGIPFDISPGDLPNAPAYVVNLKPFACGFIRKWSCNIGAEVPWGQAQRIKLSRDPDGIFRLASTGQSPLQWGKSTIEITDLQFDPAKTSILGTASVAFQDGHRFTLTNFGFTPVHGQYVPSGELSYTGDKQLKFGDLQINSFNGTLSLAGDQIGDQQRATITANASIAFESSASGTHFGVMVKDLRVTGPSAAFLDPASWPAGTSFKDWRLDFSRASVVPSDEHSMLFNHLLEPCDSTHMPSADSSASSPELVQLCLGVHLGTGNVRNMDDVVYGYATLQRFDSGTPHVKVRSLALTMPSAQGPAVRFGAGKMSISALRLDMHEDLESTPSLQLATSTLPAEKPKPYYGGFDQDIAVERLDALNCRQIKVVGEVTIDKVSFGSVDQKISATPRIGFGDGCVVFALRGFLPLQLSPQSTMMLSSLMFAHSSDSNGSTGLDYLNVGGAFTSGTVTIVFNSIGFRSFGPNQPLPHCNRKDLREYELPGTHVCAIVDVNMPMTLAATGVQNASSIEKLVGQAAGAIFGFIVRGK